MKSEKIIDGVKYITTKRASEITAYAADYIGQLCRGSKIPCIREGRTWMVSEDAIIHYTKPIEKAPKRAYKKRVVKNTEPEPSPLSEATPQPEILPPELSPQAPALTIVPEKTVLEETIAPQNNSPLESESGNTIPLHVLTPTPAEIQEIKKEEDKHDLSHSKFTTIKIDAVPQKYVHHFPEASIIDKLKVYGSHTAAFLLLMLTCAFSLNAVASQDFNFITDSKELFSYNNILDATELETKIVKDTLKDMGTSLGEPLAAVYEAVKPPTVFPQVPETNVDFYNLAPVHRTPIEQAANNISALYR